MISPFLILSVITIIITVFLFCFTNKSQKIESKIVQNLFHLNEFTAAQNMMAELKAHKLIITLVMLRTSWIAFYAYTHDGKGPSQNEINQINSENDYLQLINPSLRDFENFKRILEEPSKSKKRLEYVQLAFFIALVITQSLIIFISKQ